MGSTREDRVYFNDITQTVPCIHNIYLRFSMNTNSNSDILYGNTRENAKMRRVKS